MCSTEAKLVLGEWHQYYLNMSREPGFRDYRKRFYGELREQGEEELVPDILVFETPESDPEAIRLALIQAVQDMTADQIKALIERTKQLSERRRYSGVRLTLKVVRGGTQKWRQH